MAKFPEAQEFDMVQKGTELIQLFSQYPDVDSVLALTQPEKVAFVKKYYSKTKESTQLMEKLREEGENYFTTKSVPQGFPPEQLTALKIIGLLYLTKANLMPTLVDMCQAHNNKRREQLKGLTYTDNSVPKILQLSIQSMSAEIHQLLLQEMKHTANKRGFPVPEVEKFGPGLVAKDFQTYQEVYDVYCSQRVEELSVTGLDPNQLKIYLEESIKLNSKVWQPDTDPNAIFFYPQLVSDELYTKTGLEKPVVMHLVLDLLEKQPENDEIVQLVIREAFVLEGKHN